MPLKVSVTHKKAPLVRAERAKEAQNEPRRRETRK
jgi:hypothetical protein